MPDNILLERSFDAIRDCRMLVYGDVMIDEFIYGSVNRISPEAPVPVLEFESHNSMPGGAANAARNAVALGADCSIIGCVGDDEDGRHLNLLLEEENIDAEGLLIDVNRLTTKKTRVIANSQHVIRIDRELVIPIDPKVEKEIKKCMSAKLDSIDVVLICDYAKGSVTPDIAGWLINACRKTGTPVVVDSKSSVPAIFAGVTSVTPNMSEARALTGLRDDNESDLNIMGSVLLDMFKSDSVVVTRSEHGMTIFTRDNEPLHLAAYATEVHDVTGAGDTVSTVLSLGLATGMPLVDAALLANAAAAVVVRKVGTATPSREEIIELIGSNE